VHGSYQSAWQIQTLIEPLHIRFAFKRLDVNISDERLTGAGLGRDVHKPKAIRFAQETVFFADFRSVWSAKIKRLASQDAGKLFT
jgi:hypothetical protein